MRANLFDPRQRIPLLVTISAIALGILTIPYFVVGLAVGMASYHITLLAISFLDQHQYVQEDVNSEYERELIADPIGNNLINPIVEELLYRGLLQPLTTQTILRIAPSASASFLGTGLSVAASVSIVATAILFGFVHFFNPHENTHLQAGFTTIGGVILGVLAERFGLGSSIASHVINNTLSSLAIEPIPSRETSTTAESIVLS